MRVVGLPSLPTLQSSVRAITSAITIYLTSPPNPSLAVGFSCTISTLVLTSELKGILRRPNITTQPHLPAQFTLAVATVLSTDMYLSVLMQQMTFMQQSFNECMHLWENVIHNLQSSQHTTKALSFLQCRTIGDFADETIISYDPLLQTICQ